MVLWSGSMLMSLSPSPAPSFDYADMPSPLGESENTITVLLRPAQGRGAPIRWESPDGGAGGQGHREEASPLMQSPPPRPLCPCPPSGSRSRPRVSGRGCSVTLGKWRACSHSPLRLWVRSLDSVQPGEVIVQASRRAFPQNLGEVKLWGPYFFLAFPWRFLPKKTQGWAF